jgi:putative oxidoreductase
MSDAGAWILLLGRILFAVNFVAVTGFAHLTKGQMFVGAAKQMGFPFPFLASWAAGTWLVAGGVSIALGVWPDVGALMIAVFVIVAAAWFHRYWAVDADQRMMQNLLFWRNVTFLGAAVMLFVFFAAFGHDLPLTITDPLFDLRK